MMHRRNTAIFYSCLLVAVILIGVMLFTERSDTVGAVSAAPHTPIVSTLPGAAQDTRSTAGTVSLRWSDAQIRDLITDALSSSEGTVDKVTLTSPDMVTAAGTVARSFIEKALGTSDMASKDTLKQALKLLPENLDITATIRIAVTGGTVTASVTEVSAEGISLPATLLPSDLGRVLSGAVREKLAREGCTPQSLTISDGTLYLNCRMA